MNTKMQNNKNQNFSMAILGQAYFSVDPIFFRREGTPQI
jgi:hypothetical protein